MHAARAHNAAARDARRRSSSPSLRGGDANQTNGGRISLYRKKVKWLFARSFVRARVPIGVSSANERATRTKKSLSRVVALGNGTRSFSCSPCLRAIARAPTTCESFFVLESLASFAASKRVPSDADRATHLRAFTSGGCSDRAQNDQRRRHESTTHKLVSRRWPPSIAARRSSWAKSARRAARRAAALYERLRSSRPNRRLPRARIAVADLATSPPSPLPPLARFINFLSFERFDKLRPAGRLACAPFFSRLQRPPDCAPSV